MPMPWATYAAATINANEKMANAPSASVRDRAGRSGRPLASHHTANAPSATAPMTNSHLMTA